MPRKWQGLVAGLGVLALTGFYLWGKDKFPVHATSVAPSVDLHAQYGLPGPAEVGEPASPKTTAGEPQPLPFAEPKPPLPALASPIALTSAQEPANEPPAAASPLASAESAPPAPAAPAPVPQPVPLAPVAANPSADQAPIACPWIMSLQIVEGRSRLEARTETGVELRISCSKLQLRYPDGDIEANGHVSFAAGTMEGSCDRLTLSWRDSKIVLVGSVRLKGRQENQEVDLTGDSMTFKLVQTGKTRKESPIAPVSGSVPAPPRRLPVEEKTPEPGGQTPLPDKSTNPPASEGNGLSPGVSQTPNRSAQPSVGVSESRGPATSQPRVGVTEHQSVPVAPRPLVASR